MDKTMNNLQQNVKESDRNIHGRTEPYLYLGEFNNCTPQ
jgi:hypothetical protein